MTTDNSGKSVVTFAAVQWKLEVAFNGGKESLIAALQSGEEVKIDGYEVFNPGADGSKDFYEVSNGPYGNPMINVEPSLSMDLPSRLIYVDGKNALVTNPTRKLGGVIVHAPDGTVLYRCSLTSAKKSLNKPDPKDHIKIDGFQDDGSFIVNGVPYWLRAVFCKDKNRFLNGDDGYFATTPAKAVRLLELQDINFGYEEISAD